VVHISELHAVLIGEAEKAAEVAEREAAAVALCFHQVRQVLSEIEAIMREESE
jgi:hypothetical protein